MLRALAHFPQRSYTGHNSAPVVFNSEIYTHENYKHTDRSLKKLPSAEKPGQEGPVLSSRSSHASQSGRVRVAGPAHHTLRQTRTQTEIYDL